MFSAPAILIDLVFVAAFLLAVIRGAKKGFILTLCSLVAVVVAFLGASFIADTLSPKVSQAIQPKLEQIILEQLDEALKHNEFVGVSGDAAQTSEEVALPGVLEVLRENKLYQNLIGNVEQALEEGAAATAASAASQVAAALAGQLARGVLFAVSFFLVLVAWFILSHALDLVSKLPVINSLNRTLGGVIGGAKGLILLYLISWLLCSLTDVIPPETAEKTYLLSFLLSHSPLDLVTIL
jgi:uncharacterized membrane protein required for colicin V production